MTKAGRGIILTLIIVYVLTVIILLGWSFFTVPAIRIGALKTNWIIGNTLENLARALIPVHLSAVLFSFSLFFPFEGAGARGRGFFERLRFMGLTFLILTLLYAFLLEAGLPPALKMKEEAVTKIRQADELRIKAKDATARGQLKEARRYLQYALALFPEDEELRYELDTADRAAQIAGQARRAEAPAAENSALLLNMSFDDFLERARNAFDREDYISAEYYAAFALRMNLNHPVPKRIIAQARTKLAESRPSQEVRADMDFFRRKQAGVDILTGGGIIEAYRYFQDLIEERPEDPDVKRYLRLAHAELQKASFLLSEIPLTALGSAGTTEEYISAEGIVFINKSSGADREFLYIRRVIQTDAAYYVLDIEGIALAMDGKVLYHFGAPYGKFIDGTLLMHCVGDAANEDYAPEYYAGNPGDAADRLSVTADPEQLFHIISGGRGYRDVSLWDLVQTAEAASLLGVSSHPVYMAFFSRVFLLFSFFVLSFFAAAWGLRFRSRYAASPPVVYFFFLPLLPFIMILVFHVYQYGLYALQGFLLSALGFFASAAVFCAVQGLFLFFALLVFAKQMRQ
ncbi:MAG: hypothetical protein LBQ57_04815 [Spirochaetales bacterium]|jgi:tetratricopeptide (TPR) repeat protein|nr:hypothetical protein [Spirochaetales bacterium]